MTVATTKLKDRKQGDGVTAIFNFSDVPCLDKTFIKCQRIRRSDDAVMETYTQGAGANQFQVTLNSSFTGFTVTLGSTAAAALTSSFDLLAYRDTPVLQPTSIPYDNNLPPKTTERLFDRIVQMVQEIGDRSTRAVRLPISYLGSASLELPTPVANSVLAVWNSTGDALIAGPTVANINNAEASATAAAASATAASGSATSAASSATAAAASAASINLATFNVTGTFQLSGDITPPILTANTDNWNPTGLSGSSVIRAATNASRNLTGLQDGSDGRVVKLMNIGTNPLVLVHDATSTAANRFLCPNSTNFTIAANSGVELVYDTTSSRWRVVDQPAPTPTRTMVVLTSGTSWSVPANVTQVKYRMVGGGGGGGGANSTNIAAAGGGAGGYCEGLLTVTAGGTLAYTIGAGGGGGSTAGGSGAAGGNTTLNATITASGGAGGAGATAGGTVYLGGAGGAATGGTINIPGANGTNGVGVPGGYSPAGPGANSLLGAGGNTNHPYSGSAGGSAGSGFGSGGSGAYGTSSAGGAGAAGMIALEF